MTGAKSFSNDSVKAQKMSGSLSQSVSQLRKKAPKGTVSVQAFKDRLRLCWSYCRKRYFLYMGLPDSKVNRIAAQQKAKQIEGDMATGNFDSTLKKYKIDQHHLTKTTISKLFEQFTAEKAKEVTPKTVEKYRATLGYLNRYFGDTPADAVDSSKAEDFARYLQEKRLSLNQCKRRLEEVKACWNWAIAKNSIEPKNPWTEVAKRVKVPPKQKPKPFTRAEIEQIEQAFKSDRHYSYYADFVQFLFGTGCRTGEAIGLKWKHISDDCTSVWIGESVSRRIRKSTKTNKDRTICLPPKLRTMLLKRKPADAAPEGLVFTSARGNVIDDHNFRNRAWIKVLTRLGIDYRKPYTTRHTLISHALDLGMNPVNVAQLTGHNVRTLYENYAGNVNSRSLLPEL